ncbi:MAG: transposase [Patescibacteria group bacterium]|nr:transposase [Patescibacteria group bacterium]
MLLNELVNELDIEELIQEYHQEGKGRPAYHPQMMLKVLFYGYMNQVFSSRKLANKLRSDIGFMYISGKNKPDFRTINMFRRKRG